MSVIHNLVVPAIAVLSALIAGCVPDVGTQPSALRLTGGCGQPGTVLYLTVDDTGFTLSPDRDGLLIPQSGSLLQEGASLRDGDFILSGDACLDAMCLTKAFRLCNASRLTHQIDLVCVDGAGNPVCSGHVDEVDIPTQMPRGDAGARSPWWRD